MASESRRSPGYEPPGAASQLYSPTKHTTSSSAGSSRRARRAEKAPSRIVPVVRELAEQQRGDEEPREREEDVDAEESSRDVRDAGVERHHRGDGERTHAVEALDVAQALTDGRRVRVVERDGRPLTTTTFGDQVRGPSAPGPPSGTSPRCYRRAPGRPLR